MCKCCESIKFWKNSNKKIESETSLDKYIKEQLDMSGGGSWERDLLGIYNITYCAREKKIKIMWINIKLFFLWLKGER